MTQRDEEVRSVHALEYARKPGKDWRSSATWLMLVASLGGGFVTTWVWGRVVLHTDAQAGIAFVLLSPACSIPTALVAGFLVRRLGSLTLCAACAALGTMVGVAAQADSWAALISAGNLDSTLRDFSVGFVVAFILAWLAVLPGFMIRKKLPSRIQEERLVCPECGASLISPESRMCHECGRAFTDAKIDLTQVEHPQRFFVFF